MSNTSLLFFCVVPDFTLSSILQFFFVKVYMMM